MLTTSEVNFVSCKCLNTYEQECILTLNEYSYLISNSSPVFLFVSSSHILVAHGERHTAFPSIYRLTILLFRRVLFSPPPVPYTLSSRYCPSAVPLHFCSRFFKRETSFHGFYCALPLSLKYAYKNTFIETQS